MMQLSASFGTLHVAFGSSCSTEKHLTVLAVPLPWVKHVTSGAGQQDDSQFDTAKCSHMDKNPDLLSPPATITLE